MRRVGSSIDCPIVVDDPCGTYYKKKFENPVMIDLSRDTPEERALTLKELDEKYGKRPRAHMVIVIEDDNPTPLKKTKKIPPPILIEDTSEESSSLEECKCDKTCFDLPIDCNCVTEYCNCLCHRCDCGKCEDKCPMCDELECICNM